MRDDLQKKVRRFQSRPDSPEVRLPVLVSHGSGRDPHRTIIRRANKCVDLRMKLGTGELLRKPPDFAASGDRRVVVQEHTMGVSTLAAAKGNRDHLTAFGIIAEPG